MAGGGGGRVQERNGSREVMGVGGRDLRTILKVRLYPENNRKILMSFQIGDEVED